MEEHRFFDHWLKGIDNGVMREAPVTYFTYNEARERAWKTAALWPLPNEKRIAYYLAPQTLGTSKPAASATSVATVDFSVDDKSFWDKGLTFMTEPLASDTEVTGHPVLDLRLSTTATDADLVARVDDVAPDGSSQYYFVEGKLRASLRALAQAPYDTMGLPWHPFTKSSAQPLEPNVPVDVTLDLYPISYLFKQGHRIRLTLNFADERATQKIVPAPVVTVYHSKEQPSRLTLPIIPR